MCILCGNIRPGKGDMIYADIGEPVDPRMKCVYRLKPFLIRIGGRYFYITKDGDYELESCPFCGEKWRKGNADG